MSTRLLLVDGPNIVMRCAHGGKIEPKRSVPTAVRMIERTARELDATHVVVAWDGAANFRYDLFPDYKSHRTTSTRDWCGPAMLTLAERGMKCVVHESFEADDVLATLAQRVGTRDGAMVYVYSGDYDLAQLVGPRVALAYPVSGQDMPRLYFEAEVVNKLGVAPARVPDLKALAGEPGDGVPGVWGKKHEAKAKKLLAAYGTLDDILHCMVLGHEQAAIARRNRELLALRTDVPLPPLSPASCRFHAPAHV